MAKYQVEEYPTQNIESFMNRKRKKLDLEWSHDAEDFGEQCGFVYLLNLSGRFVYTCKFCEENFKNVDNFLNHVFLHHGFQDTRPKHPKKEYKYSATATGATFTTNTSTGTVTCTAVAGPAKYSHNDSQIGNHSRSSIVARSSSRNGKNIHPANSNVKLENFPNHHHVGASSSSSSSGAVVTNQEIILEANNNDASKNANHTINKFQHILKVLENENLQNHAGASAANVAADTTTTINLIENNPTAAYLQQNAAAAVAAGVATIKTTNAFNFCVPNDENFVVENVLGNNFFEIVTNTQPNSGYNLNLNSNNLANVMDSINNHNNNQNPMTNADNSNQAQQQQQQFHNNNEQQPSGSTNNSVIVAASAPTTTYILQPEQQQQQILNNDNNSNNINYFQNHSNNTTNLVVPIENLVDENNSTTSFQQQQELEQQQQEQQQQELNDAIISQHQQLNTTVDNTLQQNYIFDGTHLQPANYVDDNSDNTPNFYIKFNPDDGNIYLVNTLNNESLTTDLTSFQGVLQNNDLVENQSQIMDGNIVVQNLIDNSGYVTNEIGDQQEAINQNLICNNTNNINTNTLLENVANQQIESNQFNCFSQLITQSDCLNSNEINHYGGAMATATQSNIDDNHDTISQLGNNNSNSTYSNEPNNDITTTTINPETSKSHPTPVAAAVSIKSGGKQSGYFKPNFLENFQKFLLKSSKTTPDDDNNSSTAPDDDDNELDTGSESTSRLCKERTTHKTNIDENDDLEDVLSQAANESIHRDYSNSMDNNIFFKTSSTHSKVVIQKKDTFRCHYCQKEFLIKVSYDDHVRIHTGEKPYVCDLCPQSFRCKKYLDTHIKRHFGKEPFSCHFCEENFTTANDRNIHESNDHITLGNLKYHCQLCNEDFVTRSKYTLHLREHGPIKYNCENCPKKFNSELTLKEHQKIHSHHFNNKEDNFNNINFNNIKVVSSSESYVCQYCEAEFPSSRTLQRHINIIHSNEMLYFCVACETEFHDKQQYNEHLKIHNNIDANFKLDIGS